jgi:outer membrane cobalamin receptor
VGKRSRPGRESLRDYVLTSVALESQVYPGIAVSFSAENLGDNRYELIAGRNHQGRMFSLGLTGRL